MPSLEGSRVKKERAKAHLDALEQRIREFLNTNPYSTAVEPDPEHGRYLIKLRNPSPLPSNELAVIIGDCVHNMRSALDYIAWELAGADPDDRDTMFPIFDDPKKFKKHGAWRIKNIPEAPRALIEKMQPYNAPHPRLSALWAIEHLDAADKHKLLTVTVPVADSVFVNFTLPQHVEGDFVTGLLIPAPYADLKDDAVIAVFTIAPPAPDVKVEPKFTPEIAFGDPGYVGKDGSRMHVLPNLRNLLNEVDLITARLTEFF